MSTKLFDPEAFLASYPTPEAFTTHHDAKAADPEPEPIGGECPHHPGVPVPCVACAAEERIWKRRRARGEPKEFLPYSTLLTQWRARKRELAGLKQVMAWIGKQQDLVMAAERRERDALAALREHRPDAEMAMEFERLKVHAAALESRNRQLHEQMGGLHKLLNEQLENALFRKPDTADLPFDSTMWRRLMQLCHPDRHGGSEAATKASQWL